MSMCELSVRPNLNPVSPIASVVSLAPPCLSTVQSANELSNWKWPAGTVQAWLAFPGRSAQIGCSSAAAALGATRAVAGIMARGPRIGALFAPRIAPGRERVRLCAMPAGGKPAHQQVEHRRVDRRKE